jgi:hypothetical protein
MTVREPGWLGVVAAGFGGPQLSSAIWASIENTRDSRFVSKHTALRAKFLAAWITAEQTRGSTFGLFTKKM